MSSCKSIVIEMERRLCYRVYQLLAVFASVRTARHLWPSTGIRFWPNCYRQDYGDRLLVEEELSLGDMPLKADLLLIRRDPTVALPFPFDFLGERTLVEYKSPDDTATQEDLAKLEIYGLLYALREGLPQRHNLTLWLIASHFHR